MKQFFMSGTAIMGPMQYRKHFCPQDVLRQREIAAAFFYHKYRYLSLVMQFHTDNFYHAVFFPEEKLGFKNARDYFGKGVGYGALDTSTLRKYVNDRLDFDTLNHIWDLAHKTSLPSEDKLRLFCLLAAGYGLAGKTLQAHPLTPDEAESAYLRKEGQTAPLAADDDSWLEFGLGDEPIVLPAQRDPYKILIQRGRAELLNEGHTIIPRKITAGLQLQGGNARIPVTLHLYQSEEDVAPREVLIPVGEYRYVNCVGGVPVWMHPVSVKSKNFQMSRAGSQISFSGAGNHRQVDLAGIGIIDIAPEHSGEGWITLTEQGLDYSAYSMRLIYGDRLPDEEDDIVQVEFRGVECLMLDKDGYVHSNLHHVSQNRVTSLQDFKR